MQYCFIECLSGNCYICSYVTEESTPEWYMCSVLARIIKDKYTNPLQINESFELYTNTCYTQKVMYDTLEELMQIHFIEFL